MDRDINNELNILKTILHQHKRKHKHGLKYQSVYVPDGVYGHFTCPFLSSLHDSSMLTESGLREELENLFPNEDYHIYVDPAYPQSAYIFGAIRSVHGIPLTREQQQFNTSFSSVRETVEFGFKEITQQFAYTDFKATKKYTRHPLVASTYLQYSFKIYKRHCTAIRLL